MTAIPAGLLLAGISFAHLFAQDLLSAALLFPAGLFSIGIGLVFAFAAYTGTSPRWLEALTTVPQTSDTGFAPAAQPAIPRPRPPLVDAFVTRVLAQDHVWTLRSDAGWLSRPAATGPTMQVMPFWSDRPHAEAWAARESPQCQPVDVSLRSFIDDWLPPMPDDGLLVGIEWTAPAPQLEADPVALRNELIRRRDAP